eukprot:scaffold94179_cov31-Prasinocladus_malaysianus.AAC.1
MGDLDDISQEANVSRRVTVTLHGEVGQHRCPMLIAFGTLTLTAAIKAVKHHPVIQGTLFVAPNGCLFWGRLAWMIRPL